jgi:hypothetical protein
MYHQFNQNGQMSHARISDQDYDIFTSFVLVVEETLLKSAQIELIFDAFVRNEFEVDIDNAKRNHSLNIEDDGIFTQLLLAKTRFIDNLNRNSKTVLDDPTGVFSANRNAFILHKRRVVDSYWNRKLKLVFDYIDKVKASSSTVLLVGEALQEKSEVSALYLLVRDESIENLDIYDKSVDHKKGVVSFFKQPKKIGNPCCESLIRALVLVSFFGKNQSIEQVKSTSAVIYRDLAQTLHPLVVSFGSRNREVLTADYNHCNSLDDVTGAQLEEFDALLDQHKPAVTLLYLKVLSEFLGIRLDVYVLDLGRRNEEVEKLCTMGISPLSHRTSN